jgi:hypothetical protein
MSYALIKDNKILNIYPLLPKNWQNISNLCVLTDVDLRDLSWAGHEGVSFLPVIPAICPPYNKFTHRAELKTVVDFSIGAVNEQWELIPLTQEEIEIQELIEQDYTFQKWIEVREQRTNMLSACDWTQLPDCTLSFGQVQAWKQYRQALRDVPNQADPFAIVWPEPPEPMNL